MENLEIIPNIMAYVNMQYLIAFMMLTYVLKKTVNDLFQRITGLNIEKHHFAVFFIGTLVAIPFWFYWKHDQMQLFQTYCIGTALHSHIISYIIKRFKKSTPNTNTSSGS